MKWIPIFDIKNSGYYVGIDENGNWYSDTAEGLKSIKENGGIGVLPILEKTRENFNLYLTKKISQSNIEFDVETSDLIINIINLSFDVSTYWAELGIEWLNENEINSNLKNKLNKLIETKQYSQKFRQKSFEKIKKHEQTNINI